MAKNFLPSPLKSVIGMKLREIQNAEYETRCKVKPNFPYVEHARIFNGVQIPYRCRYDDMVNAALAICCQCLAFYGAEKGS